MKNKNIIFMSKIPMQMWVEELILMILFELQLKIQYHSSLDEGKPMYWPEHSVRHNGGCPLAANSRNCPFIRLMFAGFPPTWKVRESQGIWVVRESQGKVREFWMESGKKKKRRKNAK